MPNPLVYLTEDEVIRFNESVTGQKGLLRDRAALEGAFMKSQKKTDKQSVPQQQESQNNQL